MHNSKLSSETSDQAHTDFDVWSARHSGLNVGGVWIPYFQNRRRLKMPTEKKSEIQVDNIIKVFGITKLMHIFSKSNILNI